MEQNQIQDQLKHPRVESTRKSNISGAVQSGLTVVQKDGDTGSDPYMSKRMKNKEVAEEKTWTFFVKSTFK